MNRLEAELGRLALASDAPAAAGTGVRSMLLQVAQPGGWEALSRVWAGVQADLDLPAPAISVSGTDAHQLWFSLVEAVPVERAQAFLAGLRRRYLVGVPPERIAMRPAAAGSAAATAPVPPTQAGPERWSAFVTDDLAGLFADEPWLDLEPSPEAQGELLSRLHPARPADFERALQRLAADDAPPATNASAAPAPAPAPAPATGPVAPAGDDPRRFLLAVMNDPAVPLQLRIEAAKALLPATELQRRP